MRDAYSGGVRACVLDVSMPRGREAKRRAMPRRTAVGRPADGWADAVAPREGGLSDVACEGLRGCSWPSAARSGTEAARGRKGLVRVEVAGRVSGFEKLEQHGGGRRQAKSLISTKSDRSLPPAVGVMAIFRFAGTASAAASKT